MLNLKPLRWTLLKFILLTAAIAFFITPLCGYLFHCGCDWLWRGFADHCNAFMPDTHEKCPWCVNRYFDLPKIKVHLLPMLAGKY